MESRDKIARALDDIHARKEFKEGIDGQIGRIHAIGSLLIKQKHENDNLRAENAYLKHSIHTYQVLFGEIPPQEIIARSLEEPHARSLQ